MMNRLTTKRFLVRALFVASLLIPTTYAQEPTPVFTPAPEVVAQNLAESKKRVVALQFVRTELFFGTDRTEGPDVTGEEFQTFLDEVITPAFPDGLTVLRGLGQFRGSDNVIVQEKSFLLILLYPLETLKDSNKKIEKIRAAYRERFQQQSVLRVDDLLPARISF
jgi:hypothetical protein